MPAWLPRDGLVRLQHDYGIFATDAPPIYHVVSALSTLAGAVADTAHVALDGVIHPLNFWTMVVGGSTTDRKTTATGLAVSRLIEIAPDRVSRLYGSPEGFVDALVSEPCQLLYISEGAAFFEQREASYWRHAKGMFMDLYDYTPSFRRKLAKRTIEVANPRLSILSACAFPLLEHYCKITDWLGGFLPRFLMVMGKKESEMDAPRADAAHERAIADSLFNAHNHSWGTLPIHSSATKILKDFNREITSELSAYPDNLHPALCRLPAMAIRLAALYEIGARADQPPSGRAMVNPSSAQHAVALCRESRDIALVRLADTAETGTSRELLRVENIIRGAGVPGIKRSTLMRRTKIYARQLDMALFSLADSDLIRTDRRMTGGRAADFYTHVEAKNDEVRKARNQVIDPEPRVWICVEGTDDHENVHLLEEIDPADPRYDDAIDWDEIDPDDDDDPNRRN